MYQPTSIGHPLTGVDLATANCASFVTHVIFVMIVIFKDTGISHHGIVFPPEDSFLINDKLPAKQCEEPLLSGYLLLKLTRLKLEGVHGSQKRGNSGGGVRKKGNYVQNSPCPSDKAILLERKSVEGAGK